MQWFMGMWALVFEQSSEKCKERGQSVSFAKKEKKGLDKFSGGDKEKKGTSKNVSVKN